MAVSGTFSDQKTADTVPYRSLANHMLGEAAKTAFKWFVVLAFLPVAIAVYVFFVDILSLFSAVPKAVRKYFKFRATRPSNGANAA